MLIYIVVFFFQNSKKIRFTWQLALTLVKCEHKLKVLFRIYGLADIIDCFYFSYRYGHQTNKYGTDVAEALKQKTF